MRHIWHDTSLSKHVLRLFLNISLRRFQDNLQITKSINYDILIIKLGETLEVFGKILQTFENHGPGKQLSKMSVFMTV